MPTCSSATATGSRPRPSPSPSSRASFGSRRRRAGNCFADMSAKQFRLRLRLGERELAAKLDRQPELDVLGDEAVRLDVGDAAVAEPVAHALDELLGCRGARGDADGVDAGEPRLVDLRLVVDEVGVDA